MKILYVPIDFHKHETNPELFTDFLKALNNETQGQAKIYANLQHAVDFKPDIILYQGSLNKKTLSTMKDETGAKIVMWTGDCSYFPPQSFMGLSDIVDHFLVPFSGTTLDTYRSFLGKPVHFIWEPIQDWRFRTPREMKSGPIVFVGNDYPHLPGSEMRSELVTFIKKYVPELEVYGNMAGSKGEVPYTYTPDLYNYAYLSIGINNYSDVRNYFTPRNIGAIAAGSCVLHQVFPGWDNFFTRAFMFENKYQLLQLIDFFKHNPEIRNKAAITAHRNAQNNFHSSVWGEELIQILNKL